jgi:hypothetical protein
MELIQKYKTLLANLLLTKQLFKIILIFFSLSSKQTRKLKDKTEQVKIRFKFKNLKIFLIFFYKLIGNLN